MGFLLMSVLYLVAINEVFMAGIVYAFSICFKIYPVIYSLALFLLLQGVQWNLSNINKKQLIPSKKTLFFAFSSISVLLLLLFMTWKFYGDKAIYETYLYHVVRKDTKHNFSVFFYLLYLTSGKEAEQSVFLKIVELLPFHLQCMSVMLISYKFYIDLPFCFFLTTYAFVNLNKVCTSQYFIWYLTYLPLIGPRLQISVKFSSFLTLIWVASQLLWLYPAYLLEFKGINTFHHIWAASIVFFLVNNYIMTSIAKCYKSEVQESNKKAA